jgi:GntR family transcriptional regulator of vanillate catabolism
VARSRKRPAESGDTPSFAATPLMHRIREMILSGELAPGQRVTEEAVANLLGVSRTPVRKILPMLAAQGLLLPAGRPPRLRRAGVQRQGELGSIGIALAPRGPSRTHVGHCGSIRARAQCS